MSNKKDKGIVDFSEVQLREIFSRAGLRAEDIDRAIADYERYRESELSSLAILSWNELQNLGAEALYEKVKDLRSGENILQDILLHYLRYINYKKEIAETYQESKDWNKVFSTAVYSDVIEAQEAFIDYIAEVYKTEVKDVQHLQKLTGITHLDSWDNKKREYVTPETEEGAKQNALKELEDTLTGAKYSKFSRAMETALQEGAKYEDLLKIKPQDYGLPKKWNRYKEEDQYSTILGIISWEYLLGETFAVRPDLRTVARDLEAPYSLVLDAWKLRQY